jgi:DNA-binding NarL/FixJ family response regulator
MLVRVLVAEDHAFTREGLQHALQAGGAIEICAIVGDGLAAIAAARLHRPDVALLDFAMPEADGLAVRAEIARWSPATRAVILTGNTAPDLLARIVASGVAGVFTKGCPVETVIDGVLRVARGERVVSEAVTQVLRGAGAAAEQALTARELQVLQGIARGQTNGAIARSLGISPKTVDSHRTALMRKLEAGNAPALVLAAVRSGLIEP